MTLLNWLSNNPFLNWLSTNIFPRIATNLKQSDNTNSVNQKAPQVDRKSWLRTIRNLVIFLAILLILSLITQNFIFIVVGFLIASVTITGTLFEITEDNRKGFVFGGFITYIARDYKLFEAPDAGILAIANKISSIAGSIIAVFRLNPNTIVYITSCIWLYLFYFIALGIFDFINPRTQN